MSLQAESFQWLHSAEFPRFPAPKRTNFLVFLFLTMLYKFLTKKWYLCGNELASLDINFLLERTCCSERSKALSCQQKHDLTSRRHFGKEVSVLLTSLHKMNRKLPVVLSAKVRSSSPGSAAVCVCSWNLGTWFLWGLGCEKPQISLMVRVSQCQDVERHHHREGKSLTWMFLVPKDTGGLRSWDWSIVNFLARVLWEVRDGLLDQVSVYKYIHTYIKSAFWTQPAKLGTCWTPRHLTYS